MHLRRSLQLGSIAKAIFCIIVEQQILIELTRQPVAKAQQDAYDGRVLWGRHGFDAGIETRGACRECHESRKSIMTTKVIANDDTYALAA